VHAGQSGENQALAIEGSVAQLLVRRLISDSAWDHLDYLVMDLPPGTADIQQFAFALSGRPLCVLVVATRAGRRLQAHRRPDHGAAHELV